MINTSSQQLTFGIECDQQGQILRVLYCCDELAEQVQVGKSHNSLFDHSEVAHLLDFMVALHMNGNSFQKGVHLSHFGNASLFDLSGIRLDGTFIITASSSAKDNLFEEFSSLNNDLINILRRLEKKTSELKVSTERSMSQFTENTSIMWMVNPADGRIMDANRAAVAFYGYTRPQLLSMTILEISTIPQVQVLETLQANLSGKGKLYEDQHRLADGSLLVVEISSSPIQVGVQTLLLSIIHDISEYKKAQEALRDSEQRYLSLFDRMADGVYRSTPQGRFVSINPAMVRMFGYASQEEMLALNIEQDLFFSHEDRQNILKKGGKENIETFRMRRKDGSELWVEDHAQYILDEEGKVIFHEGILRDISERKHAEEELRLTQKFADLGTLAAGMAHEMDSPLQVITGDADSLLESMNKDEAPEPTRLKCSLENISRNSWRIADLVRALNLYARSSDLHAEPNSLNDLVYDTLLLIEHQLKTWLNIRTELELQEEIPDILCNRNEIVQALIHLLTNARDAMPNGGTIKISSTYDSQKNEVVLEVQDNGMGIPPEIQGKIFDPFFTTKAAGKGSGMGLSIVQGILRAHGGHIELDSTPQQGTTLRMIFPVQPAQDKKKAESQI